ETPLRRRLDRQTRELVRSKFARWLAAPDDLSVGDGLIGGDHGALARDALRRAHAEQAGARLDQSDPARGAGAAVDREIGRYRLAPASAHVAPLRIGIDQQDTHIAPVDLQLVSEDAGNGRADVLTHFRADDVHGHDAIAVEAVPNRGFEGAR